MSISRIKSLSSKIFAKSSDNILIQLFRYTMVGGLAFAVDYGLLILLSECIRINVIFAATVSFIAGLVVNYFISVKWVFGKSDIRDRRIEFLAYALIGVIGLVINDLTIYLLTNFCKVHYAVAKPLTAIMVYGWNFFARRYLIFNSKRIHNEENSDYSGSRTSRADRCI